MDSSDKNLQLVIPDYSADSEAESLWGYARGYADTLALGPETVLPTPEVLSRWTSRDDPARCPDDALEESTRRLVELLGQGSSWLWTSIIRQKPPVMLAIDAPARRWRSLAQVCQAAANAFENGRSQIHPLAPLLKAWFERPQPVTPDLRPKGTVPVTLLDRQARQGKLIDIPSSHVEDVPDPVYLPGLEPPAREKAPHILALFDLSGVPATLVANRRGEHPARRLLLEVVVSAPIRSRLWATFAVELREIRDWLWPGGWRPYRDWPRLKQILNVLNNARLPWEGELDGRWQRKRWLPVSVIEYPDDPDLDATVIFEVRIPPGGEQGPLIDRARLRAYGAASAPAWRGYLHAAYHWNQHLSHQGKPLLPTRPVVERGDGDAILDKDGRVVSGPGGLPVKSWADPRAVRTGEIEENPTARRFGGYRVFTAEDLAHWCFPGELLVGGKLREYRRRAAAVFATMGEDGAVVLDEGSTPEGAPGWRVFRPDSLLPPY